MIGAGDVCERKGGPPLYKLDGSELVLVHRRNAEAGEDFTRRHAGRYVASLDEMLSSDEIDAVYVASPHELHAEHTVAALEAGKHVLVEKPMATSTADCDRMIAAADRADRSLGVAYYRRGYPSMMRVYELFEAGTIGQPELMSINGQFPTSHRFDLVHYLLGNVSEVRAVAGGTSGYLFERSAGRLEARVTLRRGGEAAVRMSDTWAETGMPEGLVIHGERGTIHVTDLKGGSIVVSGSSTEGRESIQTGDLPYTHWGLVATFVAHLQSGTPLLCDGPEGRRSTVVLDALALSQERDGEWVSTKEL